MIEDVEETTGGNINFQEFVALMEKKILNDQRTEEELVDAFKVFDREGNGFVNADELRSLLQNMGEKLTADELEMCVRDEDIADGNNINYIEFVRNMIDR